MDTPTPRPPDTRKLIPLKLPRGLADDPRAATIEQILKKDLRPIWEKSSHQIAHVPFSASLENVLVRALRYRQIERGLEHIDEVLAAEKKGLQALQEKEGTSPANRISRLIIVANDGSERFYRSCENTLLNHADRVLLLHVDATAERLARKLFGREKSVKALLVSEKEAVSNVLLGLIAPPPIKLPIKK